MYKCTCGNDRFDVDQMQRHIVTVDSNNVVVEDNNDYQDAEEPAGTYTCTNPDCQAEYDSLGDLPDVVEEEGESASINFTVGERYTNRYINKATINDEAHYDKFGPADDWFGHFIVLNSNHYDHLRATFMYVGDVCQLHTAAFNASNKNIIGLESGEEGRVFECIHNSFPSEDQVTLIQVELDDEEV
jgi:hypothetical protein